MSNPYKKCVRCGNRKVTGRHTKTVCLDFGRFLMDVTIDYIRDGKRLCKDCMNELMKCVTDGLYNKGKKKVFKKRD